MKIPHASFVLIRHGQTDANRDGRVAGRIEAVLTEAGRQGAKRLSEWIWPKDMVLFASPQNRAQETARLGFPGQEPFLLDGIRERNWGVYEGRPVADLLPREHTPDQGEAWADMVTRVAHSIAVAHDHAKGRFPVLVAHSGVIRAARELTGGIAGGPAPENTTPYLFKADGDGWQEVALAMRDSAWAAETLVSARS
ncbi:histidine phosphatase family protein [Paracoccus sp. Z330]|uniref:Histidine phosphatase family protein n=1 Tax=Paracoccus onchidii TaxID=3017813 RepID=A0ABT4ZDF9_9RHOB|nr:histidine phosphatase family protein [Paracoccus onchidii]MDB6177403.1 histidine phosphatase family protein [Paracoccus onchidii]